MNSLQKFSRKPLTLTIIAIFFGLIIAGIVLAAAGFPPLNSIGILIKGVFSSPKHISNVIIKGTPIIMTGLGVAFAYKTGLFNIGAEGQFIMGCIAATVTGYLLNLPPILEIPIVILAGTAAGALFGLMVGFLKARFGINEVITSIMFNWLALYFSNWICSLEIFHKPSTIGTYPINESAYTLILYNWKQTDAGREYLTSVPFLRDFFLKTEVNIGFIVAVLAAILVHIFLNKTRRGYELRAVGFNKDAAEFTGIDVKKNVMQAMVISGALCGLGAALYITGNSPHNISTLAAFENYGFNGLSVAFIAAGSPIGCLFAGLLFSGLIYGGQTMQYEIGAPSEIINIVIGVIVFFMALSRVVPELIDRFARKGDAHVK